MPARIREDIDYLQPPIRDFLTFYDPTSRVQAFCMDGFHFALLRNVRDPPIVVQMGSKCTLFRGIRRSAKQQGHGYFQLDARSVLDFRLYRRQIKHQIENNDTFFRECFLDALRRYPDLGCDDFCVKVSIDINHRRGINVVGVVLEEQRSSDKRRLEGKIVLAFKVDFPNSKVWFDIAMRIPLKERQLSKMEMRPKETDWTGAYEIANALSDEEPRPDTTWQISPDISRMMARRHYYSRTFL